MTRSTPVDGTSAVIADQLTRDEGQDAALRRLRRESVIAPVAFVVGVVLFTAAAIHMDAELARRTWAPQPAPVVHCPAAPACPAIPPCAACPACPQPAAPRSHRR